MASALTDRLSRLVKTMRGQARITEDNVQDMLREVRMALLEADVALPVVRDFVARVKASALGAEVAGSLSPGQAFVGVVNRELAATMGEGVADLDLAVQPPAVILMAGLQGAGKTTTTAKLARHLIEKRRKKVLTVSVDVYRPAAIEQLKTVTRQAGAEWFPSTATDAPLAIAAAAVDHAKRHYFDVLIVDTAGRLAIDEKLMAEIRELHAALKPVETLFVVDAMQGQDAVNTAKAFKEALPLTGIVLTKMDGDSRGGAALSVRAITGAPIKFAGTSEKLADKVKATGSFDLDDFLSQISQMKKMGGLGGLLDKLPSQLSGRAAQLGPAEMDRAERDVRRMEGIICSMTPLERRKPELLKATRKRRIASGAGVQVQEVNRLLNQFEQMRDMMKKMKGGGMMKMMKRMGGMKNFGGPR